MGRIKDRNKERLVSGHCDLGNRRVYFYGKISSVSELQAHFFICCDIRERFNYNRFVEPELTMCRTFSSSDYILRSRVPSGIRYFEDRERKKEITSLRPKVIRPAAGEGYGEKGEEIVDLSRY